PAAAFLHDEGAWDAAGAVIDDGLAIEAGEPDPGAALIAMVRLLGERGLLERLGGEVSWRSVCLVRERLGHASPLLELAFTMQGLGSYALTSHGTEAQHDRWLAPILRAERVAAFALTEPEAGSDLAGIATSARREGEV